jgi:copper homeostasis protein
MLLEVIACSVEDAAAAERGGAGRIELVRDLDRGGLTPPVELVERVIDAVHIPVRVMIRETDGYEAGDGRAIEVLAHIARRIGALDVDGVVVGFLRRGQIDVAAMDAVLTEVPSSRATFHHAFDDLTDPMGAVRQLRRWPQIDRVLTSGGPGDWERKAARIVQWSRAAAPGVEMLAGGGVDRQAIQILSRAGVSEAHAGRAVRVPPTADGAVSSQLVAELLRSARQ